MITALQKTLIKSIGIELLKKFMENEQLTSTNFYQLDELLSIAANEYRTGIFSKEDLALIHSSFTQNFIENTLHGRGFSKPNGYPGDFLFLDKIYTTSISADSKYAIWDEYIQQHAAPNAVRNRKEYFKHLVKAKTKSGTKFNLLNVVSGSGRELAELYDEISQEQRLHTTCVEIDPEAILFSKELNKAHLESISYVNSNIFKYQGSDTYDFIWSAGLFDYLNDKAFVMLLKRFKTWQREGGEIVIGNFNERS